jgi:stress response protein SCP2
MAAHELQILEESLQRNKADMKSSESLVEQYRWQATQARYKLTDHFTGWLLLDLYRENSSELI